MNQPARLTAAAGEPAEQAVEKPSLALAMAPTAILPKSFQEVWDLSVTLSNAKGFVPRVYLGDPNALSACILTGLELGMGPMEAMRSLHIIEGKPCMDASAMRARAIRAGVVLDWVHSDDTKATLKLSRSGRSYTQTWTLEQAKSIGLYPKKDNWRNYPADMLRARATSSGMRAFCPDVLGPGVYVADEIEGEVLSVRDEPASTGSAPVRALSDALHEPHQRVPEGSPDPLAEHMQQLAACVTDEDIRAWIFLHREAIEREPDSDRKQARWKDIRQKAGRLTPPVREQALRAIFAEARGTKTKTPPPRSPLDELENAQTREEMHGWFDDHKAWLVAIPGNSDEEQRVWRNIRERAVRIGAEYVADELNERMS